MNGMLNGTNINILTNECRFSFFSCRVRLSFYVIAIGLLRASSLRATQDGIDEATRNRDILKEVLASFKTQNTWVMTSVHFICDGDSRAFESILLMMKI